MNYSQELKDAMPRRILPPIQNLPMSYIHVL